MGRYKTEQMYVFTHLRKVEDVVGDAMDAEDVSMVNTLLTYLLAHAFDTEDDALRKDCDAIKTAHGLRPFSRVAAADHNIPVGKDIDSRQRQAQERMRSYHTEQKAIFAVAVINSEKAKVVIELLHRLMEGKTKPKDVMMPVRAAMEAGVIRRPTWEEFCMEFGSYRLKSKASFSDYTNPENNPYTGADFQTMKEEFRKLMTEGQ